MFLTNTKEAIVFYLLILQIYINLKQKILKTILCVYERFEEIFQLITSKNRLNGCLYDFSVDYKAYNISNIIAIHKYYIYVIYIIYKYKETSYKMMFELKCLLH